MIKIVKGQYSGCRYLVCANEWYPYDTVDKATVWDYDADMGTYVNGTLGYDIDAFNALVADHYECCAQNRSLISLNEIAESIACEIEMLGGHCDVCSDSEV